MNIRSRVDTYEEEVEQDHATMNFMGANVYWPPDCPEGMLKDIITYVKDFDEDTDPLEVIFFVKNQESKKTQN